MFKRFVKKLFNLYEIKDLQIDGTCGLCGKYVKNYIVEKDWAIVICDKCK